MLKSIRNSFKLSAASARGPIFLLCLLAGGFADLRAGGVISAEEWVLPEEHLRDNGLRGDVILNGWWEGRHPERDEVARGRVPESPWNIDRPAEYTHRREVELPRGWMERELILEVGNLNSGGKVYWNGHLLGQIPYRQYAERFVEFPVGRDLLREGRQEIIVEADVIGDDVWLRSFPVSTKRIHDSYIIPSFREMAVAVELEGKAGPGERVTPTVHIFADAGATDRVKTFAGEPLIADGEGRWSGIVRGDWANPNLWSPWEPNLYWYTVELHDAGGRLVDEVLPRRFGFREVWIEDRKFMMNGVPLFFNGDNWPRTMGPRIQMHEQAVATMRMFRDVGLMGTARLSSDTAFSAADEVGVIIAQATLGGLDVPMEVVPALGRDEAGDAGGDADFTGGDREMYEASKARLTKVIKRWREHPSVLNWSIRSPWSRITLDSTRQGLTEEPWRFWPGNSNEEAIESNRRRYLAASLTADFVRGIDPHRPVAAQNQPDVEVEFSTRYLCDDLDLQEREMFFVHFMENESEKVLMPSEAGMPFPGHQFIRRSPHQMPQGPNYPAIHVENAARLFGDSVYLEEPEGRLPHWHRRDYYWHRESPVYQRLTAENVAHAWRGWRSAGINTLAHWVLREGFTPSTEITEVGERLNIPTEVDPRRPGRSVTGGHVSRDSFPLPGVDTALAGGEAYLRGVSPLMAYIGGGPGTRVFNKDHLFESGATVTKTVAVLNDYHRAIPLAGEWRLTRDVDGEVVASGELDGQVDPGARALDAFSLELTMPEVSERTDLTLSVSLTADVRGSLDDTFAFTVFPVEAPRIAQPGRRVWVIGEDRDGWVGDSGLDVTLLDVGASGPGPQADDLVVVLRGAFHPPADGGPSVAEQVWERFRFDARINGGLRVLVFEQDVGNLLGLRTEDVRPRRAFIAAKGHPILAGFEDTDFHFWTGASDLQPDVPERNTPELRRFPNRIWKVSNENSVATRTLLRPQEGAARALLVSGFDLQESPLLEVAKGRGRILFSQLDVSNRFGIDPVATRLMGRMIDYLDTAPSPDPGRGRITVVAEDAPGVEARAPVYRGARPSGEAGWGITRAELFFRESIYTDDWITREAPDLRIPVFDEDSADSERPVMVRRDERSGMFETTLSPDHFATGWGRQKAMFLHSALVVNQGGSTTKGPGLQYHGDDEALYPVHWHGNFIHPYTAAVW